MDKFNLTATTFSGLEGVLAEELRSLGAHRVQIQRRAVTFEGDLALVYKTNMGLSTALRILRPIKTLRATNERQLYAKVRKINWNEYLSPQHTFAIDFSGRSEVFTHLQYASLVIKDALVDRIRNDQGDRPSVDAQDAQIRINAYFNGDQIILLLDSSGDPLFKRGYRKFAGEAPMNEVLAAGILRLTGWKGKENLLDPMCGSGTLLIEAAFIAANIPPQINRTNFSCMNWMNFDKTLFQKVRQEGLDNIKPITVNISGHDIDQTAIKDAQYNIEQAGLEEMIQLKRQDFFTSKKEEAPLVLVFNPPYDQRLAIDKGMFYKQIGDTLKHAYPNVWAWFITADLQVIKNIGLRPSKKIPLFNGGLECRLLRYETYEGTKKNKSEAITPTNI